MDKELDTMDILKLFWVVAGIISIIVLLLMWVMPIYNVWSQEMVGKAEFAKAQQNRQIAVQEAMALKESATYEAEAEIVRAGGVAKANKIIGQSLNNNEAYLRYLWVNALGKKENMSTVYIPTEANMPLVHQINK